MCNGLVRTVAALLAAMGLVGCGSGSGTAARHATAAANTSTLSAAGVVSKAAAYSAVDLGACLEMARGELNASESVCPGFISASAVEAIATCREVGGTLSSGQQPALQSLDVNGDGQPEFLYDFSENFWCDTAPSVFSCGSLGCPVLLFEKRNGAWSTIGYLSAYGATGAEVLAPEASSPYGMVREVCGGEIPCDEMIYHRWDGSAYQLIMIEVRGHQVDFANDGLWTLLADMPVLAEPSPDAPVMDRYAKGTEVVVIGDARGTPYKYVSPCNACKSGFIDPAALRKTF